MYFGTSRSKKTGNPKANISVGVLCLLVVLAVYAFSTVKLWEIRAENAQARSIVIESVQMEENLRLSAVSGDRYVFSLRYYGDAFLKTLSGQIAPGDEITLRVIGKDGIAAVEKDDAELLPMQWGLEALKFEANKELLYAAFMTAVCAGIIIDGVVRMKKREK